MRATTATVAIARRHPLTGTRRQGCLWGSNVPGRTSPRYPVETVFGRFFGPDGSLSARRGIIGDAAHSLDGHRQMSSSTDHGTRDPDSVRAALLAGFAIVFGLWLLWGYQLVHNLQRIEQNVTTVHESYVRGEQTLSKIRTNILLGSIYLRDALIDGSRRDSYRIALMRLRTEAEPLLGSYLPEVA